MLQAEAVVDLDAIRDNTAHLASGTSAEVMAVVKADGYGHGMLPAARAALDGGATRLGVCTIGEALELRAAGIRAPILAWLLAPGSALHPAVAAGVELGISTVTLLAEAVAAAEAAGRPAQLHLKVDTGLGRSGATAADWPALLTAAAKAATDGTVEVTGVWSHFAYADAPGHPTIGAQVIAFHDALAVAERLGVKPRLRHLANSAATLSLPEAHFDVVRPGIAIYGLSPIPDWPAARALRPAMTLRGRILIAKRVPAGQGVSYGHTYHTTAETTLAVVPLGYADGVPRHASGVGPVWLGGARRTIAGRVCMDQFVVDVGDAPVRDGDEVILFGDGDGDGGDGDDGGAGGAGGAGGVDGVPTADDWAAAIDTINYEIVTRVGGRVPRTYVGAGR